LEISGGLIRTIKNSPSYGPGKYHLSTVSGDSVSALFLVSDNNWTYAFALFTFVIQLNTSRNDLYLLSLRRSSTQ